MKSLKEAMEKIEELKKILVRYDETLREYESENERLKLMLVLNGICYRCGGKVTKEYGGLIAFVCEKCGLLMAYNEDYLNYLIEKHKIRKEVIR